MWDIEEPGRKTSSAVSPKAASALAIIQRSDSCVWVTPFAGPVLPEVKKIAAGLAGSLAARGSGSAGEQLVEAVAPRLAQAGSAASARLGVGVGDRAQRRARPRAGSPPRPRPARRGRAAPARR